MKPIWIPLGSRLIREDHIDWVDYTHVEQGRVIVHHHNETTTVEGVPAIVVVSLLNPAALEGKRMRYVRHMWSFHNYVGHPLMQLLAHLYCFHAAMWVHDHSVPWAKGFKH